MQAQTQSDKPPPAPKATTSHPSPFYRSLIYLFIFSSFPPPPPFLSNYTPKAHLPIQVPTTASLFFTTHTTLWLLKIRLAPLSSADRTVKWDDPPNDNDGCPHLYGDFGAADVDSVERFERTPGAPGTWEGVFASSAWLE